MKLETFLASDNRRFEVAKVSQKDVRAEDVISVIQKLFPAEYIMYLPAYWEDKISVVAVASRLIQHLDEDFFYQRGGTMGTIYRSIVPNALIKGGQDVYQDIDENVIFYALQKGMDRIAQLKGANKMIWVFGRDDFSHDYRYSRFIKFLGKGIESSVSHKGIAVGYPSDALSIPEVVVDVIPMYRFDKLVSLPFSAIHKALLGVLALISEFTSGHVSVSFISRLLDTYQNFKQPFEDLLKWEVLEHHGYYFYSFTNMEFFHYCIDRFVSQDTEQIALSLMRRDLRGNTLFVARLSRRKGNINKALATITMYGRDMVRNGRYRKAYETVLPYYKEYKDKLSFPQMMFYLKLASSTEYPDEELTAYVSQRLIDSGKWKYPILPYLATVMPHTPQGDIFWHDLYNHWKQKSASLSKSLVLASAFIYLWRLGKVKDEIIDALSRCTVIPEFADRLLSLIVRLPFARAKLLLGYLDDGRQLLESLVELIEDSGLWFWASVVFNNLFVASYYSEDNVYPAIRLVPVLFKAYESSILYRSNRVAVTMSNYLIISAYASEKYSTIISIAEQFEDIVRHLGLLDAVVGTYYAMSFVSMEYGYTDSALSYIEKIKMVLDKYGWEQFSYTAQMWYYFAKARYYMLKGLYDDANDVLNQWDEHIGVYGPAYPKKELIVKGIEIMQGLREPQVDTSIYYYRYYKSTGRYVDGIRKLQQLFKNAIKTGNILEMANIKKFIGYLYESLGHHSLMKEHLYDAYFMYRSIEAGYAEEVQELLGDQILTHLDNDLINLYVSRLMFVEMFSELAHEKPVKDVMLKLLSSMIVPASAMWMMFQWEDFTDFVGFSITKGETYKITGFYISPSDIDEEKDYMISASPSYAYVVVKKGNAKIIIYAENRYMDNVFNVQDIIMMRQFGESVIGLLVNMKLAQQAIYDPLTGVYSRWYLTRQIELALARHRRNDEPVSLLFIDVDDFKKVNDTYGHDVGDRVLKRLGEIIRDNIRTVDVAGRYGGEEFVVLLPDTDRSGAVLVAERIRQAVENDVFLEVPITVSIGVATVDGFVEITAEDIMKMADKAMYTAKKLGKNRIFIADFE